MNFRFGLKILIYFILTGAGVLGFLLLSAWLLQPNADSLVHEHSPAEIEAALAERDVHFDPAPEKLPRHYRAVDYSAGKSAAWYPKNESPLLAELVAEGKLPTVTQRVGPEPLVLEGPDGIGRYGGTWMRVATSPDDITIISNRMSYSALFGWSPLGYPITPRVAKSIEISPDKREYLITLRKGMKWSDGHPFTTGDILYRWEQEINNKLLTPVIEHWLTVAGQPATFTQIDDYRLKITFPLSNGLFLEHLAMYSVSLTNSPAHYLKQYHPILGDSAICQAAMNAWQIPSRRALYGFMRHYQNPECPRLWPWIYRSYKANPPQVFVRNPYYFAVDSQGNQLPYVDRVQFEMQDPKMLALSATDGKMSMQARHLRFENFTELKSRAPASGNRILHWYPATRADYVLFPNLNRHVDPNRPDTQWKAELLGNKKFRQALSLAINRRSIIKAVYCNQVEPAQVAPGPESPFHHEGLLKAFTEYDPARANRMLDELGLTGRDHEGFRTFPDGSRMSFYIDISPFTGVGPAQFVANDWALMGVRLILKECSRALFYIRKDAGDFDFNVWCSESDVFPVLSPRMYVACYNESFFAAAWGRWFRYGGLFGNPDANRVNSYPPPKDHPMYRAMEILAATSQARTLEEQRILFNEALDIAAENLWTIGLAVSPPPLVVVKNNFKNLPRNAMIGWYFYTPGNAGIETYFFEENADSPGARAEIKSAIQQITPRPKVNSGDSLHRPGRLVKAILQYLLMGIILLALILVAVKHPYVGRRLVLMLPTLFIISIIVFTIIQLPPGDFLTTKIMQLRETGDEAGLAQLEELKTLFHYEAPFWERYLRWLGLPALTSFSQKDAGLLQGNLGRSMETSQRVNDIVGDRIILTLLISFSTILLTWLSAIPIGIYSAVRQYSPGDYVMTLIGFIGMCIPPFLLALILMSLTNVSGLFSAEFAAQPEWTWGKVLDLLKHIWIPIVVLGVGGTAGMIRIMRANLIEELKKPYVIAAMARGVRPLKLLFKYPVRLALNPFVSGIGNLFPQLVSGGAIVAMVLSLPTVGPLLLTALFTEDAYLAASMLMVLSLLGVFGTLVSDLLLLWLDPRIRFKGGSR